MGAKLAVTFVFLELLKPGGRCRMKPLRSRAAPISKIPRPPAWWVHPGLGPPSRSQNISGRRYKYEEKCRKMLPFPQSSAHDRRGSGKMMPGIGNGSRNCGVFGKALINQKNPPFLRFLRPYPQGKRPEAARTVFREVSKTIRRRLKGVSRLVRMRLETIPNRARSQKIRVSWDWDFWGYDGI